MLKSRRYLADIRRDITRSIRALVASPGFTVVALLSLSMGICIAACAFSEMNGIVLRNLPVVSKPDELVALDIRNYRSLRDGASLGRPSRDDGIFRGATAPRDWHPHGAGRSQG